MGNRRQNYSGAELANMGGGGGGGSEKQLIYSVLMYSYNKIGLSLHLALQFHPR